MGGSHYTDTGYRLTVRKSTDFGRTWSSTGDLTDGVSESWDNGCRAVAVAATDPNVVYAVCDDGTADWSEHYGFVRRSDDGGATWRDASGNLATFHSSGESDPYNPYSNYWHIYAVLVDPEDEDRLFVGTSLGVYLSEDGGATWSSTGFNRSVKTFAYDARREVLYVATQGEGVYVTEDGGRTWSELNDGLDITRCEDLDIDTENGYLYLGTYGGGAWRLQIPTSVRGWLLHGP